MVGTAGKVDAVNDEVQAELTRLGGVVDGLRADWEGRAQVSFDDLMQRYNTSATQLREALAAISENIRSNAKGFEGVEVDNEEAFKRTGGGLSL
jgi:WXG100 family type VII secretion target